MSGRGSLRRRGEVPRMAVGRDGGDWVGARGGVAGETCGRPRAVGHEGAEGGKGLVGVCRALAAGREAGRGEGSDEVDGGRGGGAGVVAVVAPGAAPGGPDGGGGRLRGSRGEGLRRSWWGRWGKGRGRRKVRNWQASIENAVADHRGNRDRYLVTS